MIEEYERVWAHRLGCLWRPTIRDFSSIVLAWTSIAVRYARYPHWSTSVLVLSVSISLDIHPVDRHGWRAHEGVSVDLNHHDSLNIFPSRRRSEYLLWKPIFALDVFHLSDSVDPGLNPIDWCPSVPEWEWALCRPNVEHAWTKPRACNRVHHRDNHVRSLRFVSVSSIVDVLAKPILLPQDYCRCRERVLEWECLTMESSD